VLLLGTDERRALDAVRRRAPRLQVVEGAPATPAERASLALPAADADALLAAAFRASLGYYKACAKDLGWTAQDVVDAAAARGFGMGLARVPAVEDKTLGKMGLRGVRLDAVAPRRPSRRGAGAEQQAPGLAGG